MIWSKLTALSKDVRIPYILFFICLVSYHIFMNGAYSDDSWFRLALDNQNVFQFLNERYTSWAARLAPEFVCAIIAHQPFIVFCILDICIFFVIAWALNQLVESYRINSVLVHWLIVSSILIYPILDMSAAGWMASSTNYTWTICAVLTCMAILRKYYEGIKLGALQWMIVTICVIYAGFQEQSSFLIIVLLAILLASQYVKNKKVSFPISALLALAIVCEIIMVISPSVQNRMIVETNHWMPEFGTFTLVDKAIMGIVRMEKVFVAQPIVTFLMFSMILPLYCWINQSPKHVLVVSSCPLAVVVIYRFICDYIPTMKAIFIMPDDIVGVNYLDYKIYVSLLIIGAIILSILYTFYQIFEARSKYIYIVILLAAIATQLAMGLSPTIYASTRRTSIFLFFTLIYFTLKLWVDSYQSCQTELQRKTIRIFVFISVLFSALLYIQNEIYIVITEL